MKDLILDIIKKRKKAQSITEHHKCKKRIYRTFGIYKKK